jgi:hypothetical protein
MSLDVNCQNLDDQVNGDHNADNMIGIHTNWLGGSDRNIGGHDDSGNSLSDYITSGNPITCADP